MSQGWILPDGSMSSNEMEYNTPWLFEDPISDDLPQAAGTRSAFVDPRVAAVSKTGALTDYINAGTGSSGTNTPWVPGESTPWTGGLGLPSWAANGIVTAGKAGLGMMGAPSLITGPMGALASAYLGDEDSTATQVRNKVGNSVINGILGAAIPGVGLVTGTLGMLGFDAMRGLQNTFAPDTTQPESWRGGFFDKGYTAREGSYITSGNENYSPYGGAQYSRVPSAEETKAQQNYFGGFNQPSTSSGGGWTSASSGSAYSSPSDYSGYSYSSDSSGGGWTSASSGSAYSSPSSDSSSTSSDSSSSDGGW